jgi:hypothetical protein
MRCGGKGAAIAAVAGAGRGHREEEVEFAAETRLSFTTRAPVTIN